MSNNQLPAVTSPALTIRPVTVRRPNVAAPCRQTCVIVRDASLSMLGEKESDAFEACRALVGALADPRNGDTFRCAVVDFSESAAVIHPLCPAGELAVNLRPMDLDGCTDIAAGLRVAGSVLRSDYEPPPPGVRRLSPVIVLYSDGGHNGPGAPEAEAQRLRQDLQCTIVTVAFGEDADEELLQRLASSPRHFYRAAAGADLRDLFAGVGRTMSASARAGTDPRQALGGL